MKRLILACIATVALAVTILSVAAPADELSREARARIESALLRELSPSVGVFDYVAFKLDGDGTVTLSGQVQQATLKDHMTQDAKKVEGVKRVKNQIEVLPVSPDDDRVRRAVYAAVYNQNGFERYRRLATPPIHIIVKNGSVTLEGVVANALEYSQVKAAANNIPGVFAVQNNLKIEKAN